VKHHQRHRGRDSSTPARPTVTPLRATLRALLILIAVTVGIGGVVTYSIVSRGLSAHAQPSRAEETLARAMRHWATPAGVRRRSNPVQPTPEVFAQALKAFADHCATCHANDGSGETQIGRGLYPKVPDMRAAGTQSLTDGEIFSIIEHGIRLSGMPGWGNGTPEGERESWALVHFIRRLPKLTPEDIERMEALNPKTPAEFSEQEETRRFLQGEIEPMRVPKKKRQD
jgi:mono/diheme cytochrome c family protein